MKTNLTRSQYNAKMREEAERLLREGRMPPLDKVLRGIEISRQKYRQRITEARKRVR